jgi:hypothetical protein
LADTKYNIYRYAIEGYPASKIAKFLQISKAYVSYVLNELESTGFIICINPKSKPKFYEKTEKTLNGSKLTSLTPDKLTRLSGRLELVEVQKCSFIFNIVDVADVDRKWDREYVWRKGVTVYQYTHPFENFGSIVFRRFKSENIDELMVILPRILVDKSNLDSVERFLTDFAVKAGVWYQKRFKMRLGLPMMSQSPHFAVPAKEPEIISVLQKASLKVGDIIADSSPPSLIPEIESRDKRDVVNYLEGVDKIKHLEDELRATQNLLSEIKKTVELVSKTQSEMAGILSQMVSKPSRPDEKKEVA